MSLIRGLGPQKSGLLGLADNFRTFLAIQGIADKWTSEGVSIPTVGTTGWKQREQNLNVGAAGANRIVFLPGNQAGDMGSCRQPRRNGPDYPRVLDTWDRIVTASLWSVDNDDKRDEELQLSASDKMLELFRQVINACATGSAKPPHRIYRDPKANSNNAGYGIEILVEFIHCEPLFDLPSDLMTDVNLVLSGELVGTLGELNTPPTD